MIARAGLSISLLSISAVASLIAVGGLRESDWIGYGAVLVGAMYVASAVATLVVVTRRRDWAGIILAICLGDSVAAVLISRALNR